MISIDKLRKETPRIVFLGLHPGIIQSIIDYDYLIGRQEPSVIAVIANGRKQERFFWGEGEITLPVYSSLDSLPRDDIPTVTMLINVQSARRVLTSTRSALERLPNLQVVNVFAEQTPERHSIDLAKLCRARGVTLIGPSSVGLLLPGVVKLGAIGGTRHVQLTDGGALAAGDTAVVSTSGGMVNELIHTVTSAGHGVSFAVALGGDTFPALSPADAFLWAQADSRTKRIVYFGELGGSDEYEIVQLIRDKRITKDVIAYIAGTVADLFETPPQFGHAKAMARTQDESAQAKKTALAVSGVYVGDSFADVGATLAQLPAKETESPNRVIANRRRGLVSSHISGVRGGDIHLLGKGLLETTQSQSLASLVLSLTLGRQVQSQKAVEFTDCVLKVLVDHGPQVSGAVNTIVSARAGKDLVSSLASGLLTIGPRFGGAINASAGYWLQGVKAGQSGMQFVESFRSKDGIIPGIGHKKYRLDMPDPRVVMLERFTGNHNGDTYFHFARSVEKVTTAKKGNLILNVDGAIAALMLDILHSELNMTHDDLQELVDIEFFNALFVLSRSVGFTAHYLDQRRHDEGLLRLVDDDVRYFG